MLYFLFASSANRWMLARMSTRVGRLVWVCPLLLNLLRQVGWAYLWRRRDHPNC